MSVQLAGARVLLTGATGGIGGAIARALHRRGASLILTGRRVEVLADLAAEVGGRTVAADLADAGAVHDLLNAAGHVDVLVANAALPGVGLLVEYTEEQIDRDLAVNLRAPIVLARALTEQMVKRGSGHIVLVGSLSGKTASPGSVMYNATKFGLRGFALAHRQDLHGTGVGVSIVEPGFVKDAGMFVDSGMQLPPGVRMVSPERVAAAVVRAVERNRGEVTVAPAELRLGALLGSIAPALSAAVQRRVGAAEISGSHSGAERRPS